MTRHHPIRLLSLFLACLMLSGLLVACGTPDDGSTTAQTTAAGADPNATQAPDTASLYDANGYLLDAIPADLNLGDKTLTVLYWDDVENHEFPNFETNGDAVDEAILSTNMKTEERLHIRFDYIGTPGNNDHASNYVNRVEAGQQGGEPFDIYASYSKTLGSVAIKGYCQNLLEYDDKIDFDKPWWPDKLTAEATIKNKLYFAAGDLSTNLLYMMYVLYFNKEVVENFNLDQPYDLVHSNTWTYDKFFEMASDLTAPGSPDMMYGLSTGSNVHLDPFFYGAGLHTTERDSEGTPIISPSWSGDTAINVVNEVWTFLHNGSCTWSTSNVYGLKGDEVFKQGHALFIVQRARYASKTLGDVSFDYGVVPVPKYSADQTDFSTCIAFPFTLYSIAYGAPNANEAAWALECLGSYGYRQITPALYDISMKERYAKDAESSQMYDIIRAGASFDLGRLYADDFGKYTYSLFRGAVSGDSQPAYSNQFARLSGNLNSYMELLLRSFD